MSRRTLTLDDPLYAYLLSVSLREPDVLRRLREETAGHPQAAMQIAPEQGQFMGLLARLLGERKCLEIGVFTGYSALAVALALPFDGRLVACDVSEEFTAIARRYWQEAGVDPIIRLHLAPAIETLDGLLADGEGGTFDFAFIDADKSGYLTYYELILDRMRPGGLIVIDNALYGGGVVDPESTDTNVIAIRAFNDAVAADDRVECSLVNVGDGLMLIRKR